MAKITRIDIEHMINEIDNVSSRLDNAFNKIHNEKKQLEIEYINELEDYVSTEKGILEIAYNFHEKTKKYFSEFDLENDYNKAVKKFKKVYLKLSEFLTDIKQEKLN